MRSISLYVTGHRRRQHEHRVFGRDREVARSGRGRQAEPLGEVGRSAMSIAAAPSVICDELPAVMSGAGWSSDPTRAAAPPSFSIVVAAADALVGVEHRRR